MVIKPKLRVLAFVTYFLNEYDPNTRSKVIEKLKYNLLELRSNKSDKTIVDEVLNDTLGMSLSDITRDDVNLDVVERIASKYEYEWLHNPEKFRIITETERVAQDAENQNVIKKGTNITNIEGEDENDKATEKLKKTQEKMELRFLKNAPTSIKINQEIFQYIFEYLGIKDKATMNLLQGLWYNGTENSVYSYMKKRGIKKLQGSDISSIMSDTVLQTFLVGLYTNKSIQKIYDTINKIVRKHINTDKIVKPSRIITNQGTPSNDITSIMEKIFEFRNPYIKKMIPNWRKMRSKKFDKENLIKCLEKINKRDAYVLDTILKLEYGNISDIDPKKYTTIVKNIMNERKLFAGVKLTNDYLTNLLTPDTKSTC